MLYWRALSPVTPTPQGQPCHSSPPWRPGRGKCRQQQSAGRSKPRKVAVSFPFHFLVLSLLLSPLFILFQYTSHRNINFIVNSSCPWAHHLPNLPTLTINKQMKTFMGQSNKSLLSLSFEQAISRRGQLCGWNRERLKTTDSWKIFWQIMRLTLGYRPVTSPWSACGS